MLSKSLIIFIGVGIVTALTLGIYLNDVKNTDQLIFVEGNSISVVTEKFDFKKGEEMKLQIINSGTTLLVFSDATYGLKITGLSGILMYSPTAAQVISELEPGDDIIFSWDQNKNDGSPILEGHYKISVSGTDKEGNVVKRSTIITIWK